MQHFHKESGSQKDRIITYVSTRCVLTEYSKNCNRKMKLTHNFSCAPAPCSSLPRLFAYLRHARALRSSAARPPRAPQPLAPCVLRPRVLLAHLNHERASATFTPCRPQLSAGLALLGHSLTSRT